MVAQAYNPSTAEGSASTTSTIVAAVALRHCTGCTEVWLASEGRVQGSFWWQKFPESSFLLWCFTTLMTHVLRQWSNFHTPLFLLDSILIYSFGSNSRYFLTGLVIPWLESLGIPYLPVGGLGALLRSPGVAKLLMYVALRGHRGLKPVLD